MPLARRLELLDWAAAADAIVIEDDYDSEYRYVGKPLPALMSLDSHARVIYTGTFSKVFSPIVRIGYIVVPFTNTQTVEPFRGLPAQSVRIRGFKRELKVRVQMIRKSIRKMLYSFRRN
jgi:GntR family transcriptional regulator/MocR family aminotransferase